MSREISLVTVLKVILAVIFWPITLLWYIWKKTDWSKRNKWVATAVIVVVFLFALISSDEEGKQSEVQNETAVLNSQIELLQKQLEEEKQKNKDPEKTEEIEVVELEQEEGEEEVQEETFKVVNVVDGDTVKLENGQVVRYIGIDTPETKHPSQSQECFGQEASRENEKLVEGKEVKLVKDVSETDRYDRLLRYVYIDGIFVNDYLVRNGFANASSYPPDVKYQDQFSEAEEEARNNKKGLWADDACIVESDPVPTPAVTPTPVVPKPTSSYTCNCSKTCAQMSSCAEAQYQLNVCGCSRRDGDKDGVACDSDCQ